MPEPYAISRQFVGYYDHNNFPVFTYQNVLIAVVACITL